MKRSVIGLIVTGMVLSAVVAASAQAFTIRGDTKIGQFLVKRDGTLGGAIDAFGRPGDRDRNGFACTVRWPRHGLKIGFYNLGGENPCRRSTGYFGSARARGNDWTTARGLEVGDRQRRLRNLYPNAKYHSAEDGFRPAGWWLVARRTQFAGRYPGLLAKMDGKRVKAFHVRYQAGGE